jgi:hypothetical protein
MTHERWRDSRAAGVFTNRGMKPCWGNPAPDPSADNDVNNHRHDKRPDLHRATAVEELRRDEPLLDHHIEELLDAINALQTRIGPAGASEPGV